MRGSAAFRAAVAPGGVLAGPWVKNELWRRARAVPSLDLRFAENKSLVDATTGSNLVTFTRASSGTFVGSDGVIRTAVTNLLLRSEEFDNAIWFLVNGSVSANQLAAPNGTQTADKLIAAASPGTSGQIVQGITIPSGATLTQSLYIKDGGFNRIEIVLLAGNNTSPYGRATFSTVDGSITSAASSANGGSNASATSTFVGNGWYRVSVTVTYPAVTSAGVRLVAFNSDNAVGDGIKGIFLWGAQLEQSSTVGEYIPTTSTINSAPRFDHNPTTGESLGLLVEEQRTNSIRNNTMVGAVAGSPGTIPTNWVVSGTSGAVTRTIVGTGTNNGIAYIDIRYEFSGSGSAFVNFEGGTQITAANGQVWAASHYSKLQNGSLANLTLNTTVVGYSSLGAVLEFSSASFTPSSSELVTQRRVHTRTLNNASTAFVSANIGISASAAADITLRIGLPQLEQGAFATSVIPTSTTAVTRSADVASISGSNFSAWYRQDEGTFYGDVATAAVIQAGASRRIASASDGTNNQRVTIGYAGAISTPVALVTDGGVAQALFTSPAGAYALPTKVALSYAVNRFAASVNGSSFTEDTSGTVPVVNQLRIGDIEAGGTGPQCINGAIRRLAYFPRRLGNEVLQGITQ
jgi:hypothetical protein